MSVAQWASFVKASKRSVGTSADPGIPTHQYLTLPGIFHMEWCIKYDKIETLTMEYTWNGME